MITLSHRLFVSLTRAGCVLALGLGGCVAATAEPGEEGLVDPTLAEGGSLDTAAPDAASADSIGASQEALWGYDENGLPKATGTVGIATPPQPPENKPPAPSDDPEGNLDMYLLRFFLQAAGEEVIADANQSIRDAGYDFTLRWMDDSLPLECGYDCGTAPGMYFTTNRDWPNYWYAYFDGKLKFRLDMYPGIHRDIYVRVPFRVSCQGFEDDGVGEIRGYQASPRIHIEGGSTFESVLDFLFPGGLSDWIDGKVRENLPQAMGGQQLPNVNGQCTSLGYRSHYNTGEWQWDSIVWDVPEPAPTYWYGGYLSNSTMTVYSP